MGRVSEGRRFRGFVAPPRPAVSYLVDADDPRLQGERLLSGAIAYWRGTPVARHAICFGVQRKVR